MKYPTPQEVKTTLPSEFMGLCDGLMNGSEKEATVRVFCLTAQKHNRWELTQDELDERDGSGRFYWHGLISEGWFEEVVVDQTFNPTDKFFGRLMANGLIDHEAKSAPELKMFMATVEGNREVIVHLLLALDEQDARNIIEWEYHDSSVAIKEVEGPFKRGSAFYECRIADGESVGIAFSQKLGGKHYGQDRS